MIATIFYALISLFALLIAWALTEICSDPFYLYFYLLFVLVVFFRRFLESDFGHFVVTFMPNFVVFHVWWGEHFPLLANPLVSFVLAALLAVLGPSNPVLVQRYYLLTVVYVAARFGLEGMSLNDNGSTELAASAAKEASLLFPLIGGLRLTLGHVWRWARVAWEIIKRPFGASPDQKADENNALF